MLLLTATLTNGRWWMDSKRIQEVRELLTGLIPAGTEVNVKSYDWPKCEGAVYKIEPPCTYIIRVVFPYKKSLPLYKTNRFSLSYRTQTLDISDDHLEIIIKDLISQESTKRTEIRHSLESARRAQFLWGNENIRVSGESTRNDIKIKDVIF